MTDFQPPTRPVRIVFATNSDAGQLNVQLAVLHSLLEHHKHEVELHLCTFQPGEKRCPAGVTYHQIPGMSMVDVLKDKEWEAATADLMHPPSFLGVLKRINKTPYVLSPYTASEYVDMAQSIEKILESIKPDLVVVDNLLPQASDAAKRLGMAMIILSPNAWMDNVNRSQGLGIFKWPVMGTGWPFPLPIYLLPLNIILVFSLILTFLTSSFHRSKMAARKAVGYTGRLSQNRGVIALCMGLPELEAPGINPPNIFPVGPMLLPTPPLGDVDPDLWNWLNRDGYLTITFALGSHFMMDKQQAERLLGMFAEVLERREDVRFYAKIMRLGEYEMPLLDEMEKKYEGRLRVVEWMKTDPVVVLRTGKVGLAIHHGGSNSYHEALSHGIPQIAVAGWFDCYDFAARIEHLGIGKWGNRRAGPGFTPAELLSAINGTIGQTPSDGTYAKILSRAKECAEVVARAGKYVKGPDGSVLVLPAGEKGAAGIEGRDVAGEWIYRKARASLA